MTSSIVAPNEWGSFALYASNDYTLITMTFHSICRRNGVTSLLISSSWIRESQSKVFWISSGTVSSSDCERHKRSYIGDGSKLKGAIRLLLKKLTQKPKIALATWRAYV